MNKHTTNEHKYHLYRIDEAGTGEEPFYFVVAKSFRDAVERWAAIRAADDSDKYANVAAVLAAEQPNGVLLICGGTDLILPGGLGLDSDE